MRWRWNIQKKKSIKKFHTCSAHRHILARRTHTHSLFIANEKLIFLSVFLINRWFNYIKLPSGWHSDARNTVVQGCQSSWAIIDCRYIQRWHRITNFNNTSWWYWRLYVHSAKWRRTSVAYGTRYYCWRRCDYGKTFDSFIFYADFNLFSWLWYEEKTRWWRKIYQTLTRRQTITID